MCKINTIKMGKILVSFFKENKENIFSGSKFLIALVVSNIAIATISVLVTYFITKKLERVGEPEITANIESIALFQNINSNYCEGELVLNITNIENKPTYLIVDTVQIGIIGVNGRPFLIYVNKKIPLNGFEFKCDTVKFELREENLLSVDTTKSKSFSCKVNIYYPNNKIAKTILFDTTTPRFELIYNWEKWPYLAFYQLRDQYKNNLLPKQWKKLDVLYYGTNYDCYYYTEDNSDAEVVYQGERLKYEFANEKYYPMERDSNKFYDNFVFIPHPKIENKFINIDERCINIAVHCGNYNKIDIVKKVVGVKRGYLQVFNIRY